MSNNGGRVLEGAGSGSMLQCYLRPTCSDCSKMDLPDSPPATPVLLACDMDTRLDELEPAPTPLVDQRELPAPALRRPAALATPPVDLPACEWDHVAVRSTDLGMSLLNIEWRVSSDQRDWLIDCMSARESSYNGSAVAIHVLTIAWRLTCDALRPETARGALARFCARIRLASNDLAAPSRTFACRCATLWLVGVGANSC